MLKNLVSLPLPTSELEQQQIITEPIKLGKQRCTRKADSPLFFSITTTASKKLRSLRFSLVIEPIQDCRNNSLTHIYAQFCARCDLVCI